jgi:hypothetical protein
MSTPCFEGARPAVTLRILECGDRAAWCVGSGESVNSFCQRARPSLISVQESGVLRFRAVWAASEVFGTGRQIVARFPSTLSSEAVDGQTPDRFLQAIPAVLCHSTPTA